MKMQTLKDFHLFLKNKTHMFLRIQLKNRNKQERKLNVFVI